MLSAVLLIAYAVTAGTVGAGCLEQARWPAMAPRLAIAAWHAVATSVLLALSAAGLALAVSFPHVSADLAHLLNLCAENLQHAYSSPRGLVTALIGSTLVVLLLARTTWWTLRTTVRDRRERNERISALDMVGRADVIPGSLVIEHGTPYAFCIGGRQHRVVVTSGMVASLNSAQLDAVLAHEQEHLSQRHHRALLRSRILFGILSPAFPVFRRALGKVSSYVEWCADDGARRRVEPGSLRDALARLACIPAPPGALSASAIDVHTRLVRLEAPRRRLSALAMVLVAASIGAAIVVPLFLAASPALTLAWEGVCLLG